MILKAWDIIFERKAGILASLKAKFKDLGLDIIIYAARNSL